MARRLACLLIAGPLVGCAVTPRPAPALVGASDSAFPTESVRISRASTAPETIVATDLVASSDPGGMNALWRTDSAFALEPSALEPSAFALPASDRTLGGSYVTLKGGTLYPEDNDFDSGYVYNASFGRYFTSLLAVEFETGYMSPDPKAASTDVWAIPLLLNARVCVPVWMLEIYGGGGIGSMYYDFSSKSVDATGWLASADFFVGADIQLMDRLMAGLELKYYITDKLRNTSDNLNALAVMLTVGFKF